LTLRNGSNLSDVVLVDTDAAALDRARASSRVGARLARLKRRGDTIAIDDDLELANFRGVEGVVRLALSKRS
jgi:chromosome condensin MukBEF MukE localization factor